MKSSPLRLEQPEYPRISVKAIPKTSPEFMDRALPITITAGVTYDLDGRHFAHLMLRQEDESYPYVVEIDAFCLFSIDTDGCKASKRPFNPSSVGVNVISVLYSSARELLAFVTARAPYGAALLDTAIIEATDVPIGFEDDKVADILSKIFGMSDEQVSAVIASQESSNTATKSKPRKKQAKRKGE